MKEKGIDPSDISGVDVFKGNAYTLLLSGSVQKNHATPNSDLDLYIVLDGPANQLSGERSTFQLYSGTHRIDAEAVTEGKLLSLLELLLADWNIDGYFNMIETFESVNENRFKAFERLTKIGEGKVLHGNSEFHNRFSENSEKISRYGAQLYYMATENRLEDVRGYLACNDLLSAYISAHLLILNTYMSILNMNGKYIVREKWVPLYLERYLPEAHVRFESMMNISDKKEFVLVSIEEAESLNDRIFH